MSIANDARTLVDRTATEFAALIASGDVSSAEVVEAHIARIEETAAEINAVPQPRFDRARVDAKAADGRRAAGQRLGPLDGVPITIKDCFAVAGTETTLGIPGYSRGPAAEDAPLVQRLRAAGAVVLGKTNVPQAMLMHECDNPAFGRTTLPGRPDRSPGGSSGGGAAIVAAGGSPLSLGSDLGGSIRQPAAACGVFGFKPSTGRLTLVGSERAISRGMRAIAIQPGPMTRCVADLDLAMRAMVDFDACGRQEDESPIAWPDYRRVDVSGLRAVWWADDGVFAPAPAIARAVRQAAERLAATGAEVLAAKMPDPTEMMAVYLGLISADGMASVRRSCGGGPRDRQLRRQLRLAGLPRWARAGLAPLLRAIGQPDVADLLGWTGRRSAEAYWRLTVRAQEYRRRFWRDLQEQAGGPVDIVLSPAYGLPALRHGTALHLLRAASHAFLANLLDAPAGVVPMGAVTAEEEHSGLGAYNTGGWNLTARFARLNAKGSTGLPTAVEVMAPAGRDDAALAGMAAIEAAS